MFEQRPRRSREVLLPGLGEGVDDADVAVEGREVEPELGKGRAAAVQHGHLGAEDERGRKLVLHGPELAQQEVDVRHAGVGAGREGLRHEVPPEVVKLVHAFELALHHLFTGCPIGDLFA